ncbi:MAG: 1-hydroxycarotenoid 3,4-desaturase CrtD [Bacteroidales bacterium]
MHRKAIIIGSGIGGIATAVRLAIKGLDVSVFEKNDYPGGKIAELNEGNYRFDSGPTVFTLPHLVDELFKLAGKQPSEYFKYRKLDSSARYFWEDGVVADSYSDTKDFISELSEKTGEKPHHIRRFLGKSKELYDLTSDVFIFNSIHERTKMFKKSSLKALINFHKLDVFSTMHEANQKQFASPKVIQFFDRYATYNGSNPYKTPATLNVIPHLEHNTGAYFPEKGMYSLVKSLVKLAREIGVKFNFNDEVLKLHTNNSRVTEVESKSGIHNADYVVSDMDIHHFYQNVFNSDKHFRQLTKQEKSSSALIFYWGMTDEFPEVGLHNILFSENYESEFQSLFDRKEINSDPTVYIFVSSKQVSGDAPVGKENWYVMINAPENIGQDWDNLRNEARENILNKIERILGKNVRAFIEYEKVSDPLDIERLTGAYHGSLYGNSSNGKFAAFNRHPNFSRAFRGLYFTGGSVHPGGGIPLALASARIVADKIKC